MTKKEIIWRQVLHEMFTKKTFTFTQKDLAAHFGFSTSTLFNALKAPRKSGAIEVTGRNFRLRDAEKLLLLWATQRNLKKDIIYSTHVEASALEIEGGMPGGIIFGAFSAYRLSYHEAPADYDRVVVYSDNLVAIEKRFPKKKGQENLFVIRPDRWLKSFGPVTPPAQTFVDLWNLSEWYAKDFLNALRLKLKL